MTDNKRDIDSIEDTLTEHGLKNRVSGAADQLAGKARNAFGAVTDDAEQQMKGKAQELKGDAKEALGKAQMAAADAIDESDDRIKKH